LVTDKLPRILATATDYASLMEAFRERTAELGITRLEVDEIAGIPSGYAGKLLGSEPIKHVGAKSLGPLLGALALKLVVVEDTEMLPRILRRLLHRSSRAGRPHRRSATSG
jgi:hypothetical protein